MNLSAPRVVTFIVAVALMAFGIVSYYTDVIDVDVDVSFMTLAAGGILLTLSTLFKDL